MGCGGSRDAELFDQPRDGELIPNLVGDHGRSSLKCAIGFGVNIGVDPQIGVREKPMALSWDVSGGGSTNIATLEPKKNAGGGLKLRADGGGRSWSYDKAWSSEVIVRDTGGNVVALMRRELIHDTHAGRLGIEKDRVRLGHAIIYCSRPRRENQAPAQDVTTGEDTGEEQQQNSMYAWAKLMPARGPGTQPIADGAYANFAVFALTVDGATFEAEPTFIVRRSQVNETSVRFVSGSDRSQAVGMATLTKVTAAHGVDPILLALALLEFKLWTQRDPVWTNGMPGR